MYFCVFTYPIGWLILTNITVIGDYATYIEGLWNYLYYKFQMISTCSLSLSTDSWNLPILYRNTKVKVAFLRCRHRPLRHCNWGTARGHPGPIPLYHLSRLRAYNMHSIKSKKTVSSWQRKEAKGTPQKQLPMPTTPMI